MNFPDNYDNSNVKIPRYTLGVHRKSQLHILKCSFLFFTGLGNNLQILKNN